MSIHETCTCNETHYEGASYYLTAKNGKRVAYLSGPYSTHAACLADQDQVQRIVLDRWSEAAFFSWGSCAVKEGCTAPGVLQQYGLFHAVANG